MNTLAPKTALIRRSALFVSVALSAAFSAPTIPALAQSVGGSDRPGSRVEDLLAIVRNLNPEVAAAALESEAAIAKIVPAGALDDPMVSFSRDQSFRQTMATVSQEFPLWGKRALRREVATAQALAARSREDTVATEIQQRVKVTFAQYYESKQSLRVTNDIHALLHIVESAAKARYAQGLANQSDAIRAAVEQTRLDQELPMLRRNESAAEAKLNALLARPADAALADPISLRRVPRAESLTLNALFERAQRNNPGLASARAEIRAATGERQLVDKSYYPGVTLGAGISDLPDMSPRFVGTVGVKIPFQWGVREAQAREAAAKKGAAQKRLDASMLEIESGLKAALASLRETQQVEDLLKNGLRPQTEAAYRSALSSYQLGRGDLTPVLEAAHQQLQVRLDLLKAQTEQQAALADIERMIGEDL
jgi:cobalt-zinc-cadmium efflux system outer membrane protein